MADGKVRLRSNVVTDGRAWRLVPGELVGLHRPDLLQLHNRPPPLQRDEHLYYTDCGRCGRAMHVSMLEGCDQCTYVPKPAQLEAARTQRRLATAALDAARAEIARSTVETEERRRK